MKKSALIVISLGVVLLLAMSSVYMLMPGEASLEMEKGREFTGLDPWALQSVRSPPAKVGEAVYLLMIDAVAVGDNATYERNITRLDLGSGAVDNYTLEPLGEFDNDTYVRGLLEGDGELYAYGWRSNSIFGVTEIVLWKLDPDSMQFGEPWVVPGIVNATNCDLLIEDGVLYKMPGYAYELDEDGVNTSMIVSPTIMTWDISEREIIQTMDVPEELCDSTMLPFGDEYFGYWPGLKYLSDSFVFDPETGTSSPIDSLEDYDHFRASWGEVAVSGDAIIFPYLSEYVDLKWGLSDTVIALDRSYDVTEGALDIPESVDLGWLMGCADDEGAVVLHNQVPDLDTLNITAYHLIYEEGAEAFHPLLFAVPLAILGTGVLLLFRKGKE